MQQVTLEGYLVRVRERQKHEARKLGNFDDQGSNLLALIFTFLSTAKDSGINLELQRKSVLVEKLEKKGVFCRGILRVGEFGYSSPIVNIESGKTDYQKQKHNADMVPFYFEFCLPPTSEKGILLVQRFGQLGIKNIIENTVVSEFRRLHKKYMLDLTTLVPGAMVDTYLSEGKIKTLKFIKHQIPSDIADRISGKQSEQEGQVTLSVEPKDPSFFPLSKIKNFFNKQIPIDQIYEIDEIIPDNIKAIVDIDGRDRTIDFSHPWRLRASFDVTEQVNEGLDGYPDYKSLEIVSNELIEGLANSSGILL